MMEHLFEEFHHRMFILAVTYLNSEDEARDIVQDVFETIWQQWEKNPSGDKTVTSSYLYTLTKNRCLDRLRHHQAHRNYIELLTHSEQFDTAESVEEYERSITRLLDAIEQLPEPGKTILHCCYFKRMSYKQTAEVLQLSLVVVRKNMLKVFKILRETLKNTND